MKTRPPHNSMKSERLGRHRPRRASSLIVAGVLVAGLVTGLAGCGGGSSSSSTRPTVDPLTEGTKDTFYMPGGKWATDNPTFPITGDTFVFLDSEGIMLLHKHLVGPLARDPDNPDPGVFRPRPPLDIRQAWQNGWTGQGVNILIVDNFGIDSVRDTGTKGTHGYQVMMSAYEYAPRARYYALQGDIGSDSVLPYGTGGVRHIFANTDGHEDVDINVINWSIGTLPVPTDPLDPNYLSDADLRTEARRLLAHPNWDDLRDIIGVGNILQNARDAVITKAGGNEVAADAGRVLDNLALVLSDAGPRTLIVGALDKYAQDGGAQLADYSNIAGDLVEMQQRFLVEYGGSPFLEITLLTSGISGDQFASFPSDAGTSFSAPRVAGHAALVRDKFPNLSGAQTASILLDTATYEGLVCAPDCPVREYGQGRVDIGAALAPIGVLR